MSERVRGLVADFGALLGFALLVYGLFLLFGGGVACAVAGALLLAFSVLLEARAKGGEAR